MNLFLYQGEPVAADVRLADPTQLRNGVPATPLDWKTVMVWREGLAGERLMVQTHLIEITGQPPLDAIEWSGLSQPSIHYRPTVEVV